MLGEACPFSASEASAAFCFFLGGIVNGDRACECVYVPSTQSDGERQLNSSRFGFPNKQWSVHVLGKTLVYLGLGRRGLALTTPDEDNREDFTDWTDRQTTPVMMEEQGDYGIHPFSGEDLWRLSRFTLQSLQPLEPLPWNEQLPGE